MTLNTGVSSVFSENSIFSTLAAAGFAESGVSSLSRAFRTVLDPTGIQGGVVSDTRQIVGYSNDTPSLFYRPVDIGLTNTLLLSSQVTGVGEGGFSASSNTELAQRAYDYLNNQGLIDSLPTIRNIAGSILSNTSFEILLSEQAQGIVSNAVNYTAKDLDNLIVSYTNRPSELDSFGTTYDGVVEDDNLNTQFFQRISLAQGESINLAELLLANSQGSPTDLAIRLLSEVGSDGVGTITDSTNTEISKDTVIVYSDLANYTYTAANNKNTDYLSFIELEDADDNGTYEARGEYQTVSITTSGERADAYDGDEPTLRYTFYTEDETSTKRLTLLISGVDSLGYTDALDAIEQNDLRVKASETLPDGNINMAITDLYVSDANDIVVQFAYQQAADGLTENGIDVELRGLETSLDLTGVTVSAIFA
ncbi:hypothetical protein [Curvivirga aplysinae]|uniref:hypothetical protein n=1 Tax=Curvivirga aplysinae TaxID=2529852 RepID=UPI0012BBED2B|nr:hypothetical protein [Curvivirga aplysinae]MTI11310.1 hypothetical protein [Curvivirga aplysinae]